MTVPIPENIDEIVHQYVMLRDKIKESDKVHKEKTKPARDHLEVLNNKLLERLIEVGGESVKTTSGTVYKTVKKSASIADGDTFRSFIIDNELYDLVDWKANPTATADYIEEHQVPPPGVNYSTYAEVGVRRS
jgi:hypothetical protein